MKKFIKFILFNFLFVFLLLIGFCIWQLRDTNKIHRFFDAIATKPLNVVEEECKNIKNMNAYTIITKVYNSDETVKQSVFYVYKNNIMDTVFAYGFVPAFTIKSIIEGKEIHYTFYDTLTYAATFSKYPEVIEFLLKNGTNYEGVYSFSFIICKEDLAKEKSNNEYNIILNNIIPNRVIIWNRNFDAYDSAKSYNRNPEIAKTLSNYDRDYYTEDRHILNLFRRQIAVTSNINNIIEKMLKTLEEKQLIPYENPNIENKILYGTLIADDDTAPKRLKILLYSGIDINKTDNYGRTVFDDIYDNNITIKPEVKTVLDEYCKKNRIQPLQTGIKRDILEKQQVK